MTVEVHLRDPPPTVVLWRGFAFLRRGAQGTMLAEGDAYDEVPVTAVFNVVE
jgi:hypothetical protein